MGGDHRQAAKGERRPTGVMRRPEPLATHAADALLLVAGPALAAALACLWHSGPFWTDARTVRARCRFVCVSVGVRAHIGGLGRSCMRRVIFTHAPPGTELLRQRATATT